MPPHSLDLPIDLYQVLEEEYLALHGELDETQTIAVEGQPPITAKLGYLFHEGHIKDGNAWLASWKKLILGSLSTNPRNARATVPGPGLANLFAAKLQVRAKELRVRLEESKAGKQTDDPQELENRIAVLESVGTEILAEAKEWTGRPDATKTGVEEQWVIRRLNALLEVPFYDYTRFKHVRFSESTRQLIDLYERSQPTDEELLHFNRTLLEEIFPDDLRRLREIRLAAIFQRIHKKKSAAISLSGGGTRSGTFALGLLQGLAGRNLLDKFDYLSTVSGGGYIGSWLTVWAHRHKDGLTGVIKDLDNRTPHSKIDPDSSAVNYLRAHSNFITPRVGLFTADTWSFIAIYLRNLLLNWIVLFPLVISFLLLPRFIVSLTSWDSPQLDGVQFAIPFTSTTIVPGLRHVLLLIGVLLAICSMTYTGLNRPLLREQLRDYYPKFARGSDQTGFVKYCLLPLVISAVLLTTYWAWTDTSGKGLANFISAGLLVPWASGIACAVLLRRRPTIGETIAVGVAGILSGVLVGAAAFAFMGTAKGHEEIYACLAVPLFLVLFMIGTTLFVGLSSHSHAFNDEDREWWARFSGWILIAALSWGGFASLVIFGPRLIFAAPGYISAMGGLSGVIAALIARSAKTPATDQDAAKGGLKALIGGRLLPLLAFAFLAFFVAVMSIATDYLIRHLSFLAQEPYRVVNRFVGLDGLLSEESLSRWVQFLQPPITWEQHLQIVRSSHPSIMLVVGIVLLLAGFVLARSINLNLFSLHGGYRNRLIGGFLAASRPEGERRPNPFTGFDPMDNVYMHELRPALLREADFTDLRKFTEKLYADRDKEPARGFLFKHFSEATCDALSRADLKSPLSARMKGEVIEDLNRILEEQRLDLETTAFARALRNPLLQKLLRPAQERRGYRIHLNRFILDTQFEGEILRGNYPPHRLLHLINISLNLVAGDNLAWQQRKAESFTVSPLHSGSYRVGYRRSKAYGGDDGISIGTAIAVSGAAASSNMGYYTTSPLLSLLMTLFNVRLGWWLGNPGTPGSETYIPFTRKAVLDTKYRRLYRRASPTLSVFPVISEALGKTNDRSQYVYLTDGGHFENLALYEMVLRRCHLIVLSDGAADPKYQFSDLGNAVRKIRIDFGIPIEFIDMPIHDKKPEGQGANYWTMGRIRYSEVDGKDAPDGILIYVKPCVYGNEPEDVLNYKRSLADFPHETTADQFFDEPQFESHRMLGKFIMEKMCQEVDANSADPRLEFVRSAFSGLRASVPKTVEAHEKDWNNFEEWIARSTGGKPFEGAHPDAGTRT